MATLRVHFMRGSVEAAFFDPLERLNGEIKRRSDVVGIFPTKMPLRLVGASCSNRTANGPFSISPETIAPLNDDPIIKLPAMAAGVPSFSRINLPWLSDGSGQLRLSCRIFQLAPRYKR